MAHDRMDPDLHIAAAKRRLQHLSRLADKSVAAEQKIKSAAEKRLSAVDAELVTLRPRVNLEEEAGDRYQDLTLERGQLATVIESARVALGQ
jgi:hypothetical protein